MGIIFDIMRYAIHDGPGIRTLVFFKGCPMDCWWCHNPEGQARSRELMLRQDRCIGCGQCLRTCKHGAIAWTDGKLVTTGECKRCFECVGTCPSEARVVVGREVSVGQVVEEIEKDRVFYEQSGGGVTFSGGEPLMQPVFLNALLTECSRREIHTAVETAGMADLEELLRISDRTHLFLYDLKLMDHLEHQKYTGVSNRVILDNLRALSQNHDNVIVRIPIIPGINDGESSLGGFIDFLLDLKIREVHLLPYHKTGEDKYRRLSRRYKMPSVKTPDSETMERISKRFGILGKKVKIGG